MGKPYLVGAVPFGFALLALLALLAGCGGSSGGEGAPLNRVQDTFGDREIVETFVDTIRMDSAVTDANWGQAKLGTLQGLPVVSRTAYVYSYPETNSGTNSGRGQYGAFPTPLTGADLTVGPSEPPVSQGRRVQWTFSDTQLGTKGTITGIAWGPDRNMTVAATYPNVRLRMGFQATSSLELSSPFGASFAGTPVMLYNGQYQVLANASVGNTPGYPTTAHIGGYPENPGCAGSGTHNAPLFLYTGWYSWPALTQTFAWDPGDPQVANDSVLVFDASVQMGNFTQNLRGWFGSTYPCSGILIAGRPRTRMYTTYEADTPNPPDNFVAGIFNPEPSVNDMRFTFTQLKSTGQSVFMAGAYGDDTDYGDPAILPATQPSGATYVLEFQGADGVGSDGVTIDTSKPFTSWSSNIDACDGMQYIRFRFTLIAGATTSNVATIDSITIPMEDLSP